MVSLVLLMEYVAKKIYVKNIIYILIVAFSVFAFYACREDDDFSSDKSLKLTFSTNTVDFDTVFSSIGSATKQFKIYNRNKNSLLIESIELVNAAKSGFKMNIDGEKGTKLSNVEILKKDSLYGFVEITVDPQDEKNPLLIRDSIRFVVNGNAQYVQLMAVGQDVYIWKHKVVTKDSVLTDKKPLLIYNSLTVNKDVTLTVNEGVTFFMKDDVVVDVYGTLKVEGTLEKPVIFRGSRFDNIEGNIPYDNVPGQWGGIIYYSDSYNNTLTSVVVKNASKGITFEQSDPLLKKAILSDVVVQNSSEYGIQAVNCNIEAQNCLFANSRGSVLSLYGGEYSFLHCTVANYYRWTARQEESLLLSNRVEDKGYPLTKCDFTNSIIYGSVSNELVLNGTPSVVFNYQFRNCLIKGTEQSDSHFVNTIWNSTPLFKDLNNEGIYSYNFELEATSPAKDKADKAYSIAAPIDLKGNSRLNDSNPDIGCYEWIK